MESDRVEVTDSKKQTYTEIFKDVCPYYMSMGMSYEQFWYGPPEIAKYYREMHEYKNKQINQEMWWMGLYVRDALLCTVGNMFSKKGNAIQYPKEPYPLTEKEAQEYQERQQREKMERILEAFKARTTKINDIPRNAEKEGE